MKEQLVPSLLPLNKVYETINADRLIAAIQSFANWFVWRGAATSGKFRAASVVDRIQELSTANERKIEYSHSPFPICCILSEYVKRTGEIVMAISTQDIEFNNPLHNLVSDSTAVFDESFCNSNDYANSEGLSVASKLNDDEEDEDEDDEDEDDEDEDDEDEDDEVDDDEEDEDEDLDEDGDDDEDEDDEEEEDEEDDEVPVPKRR
jgi:hypothetical protein